ncbi:AbrB family transcriptional regulator [Bacillus sp. FSL W7-1360]
MVVKEMERKVTKIGSSIGMTFPPDVLEHLNIAPGDHISIEKQSDGTVVLRKSEKIQRPTGLSADFFDVLQKTVAEYDETIKGLVDR